MLQFHRMLFLQSIIRWYCHVCNSDCHTEVDLCFAVDDLLKNYRHRILKVVKRPRTNPRLRSKLHPPLDILSIDAKTFAEQLTYIDAVSTTNYKSEYFMTLEDVVLIFDILLQ